MSHGCGARFAIESARIAEGLCAHASGSKRAGTGLGSCPRPVRLRGSDRPKRGAARKVYGEGAAGELRRSNRVVSFVSRRAPHRRLVRSGVRRRWKRPAASIMVAAKGRIQSLADFVVRFASREIWWPSADSIPWSILRSASRPREIWWPRAGFNPWPILWSAFASREIWWPRAELNHRHKDFQTRPEGTFRNSPQHATTIESAICNVALVAVCCQYLPRFAAECPRNVPRSQCVSAHTLTDTERHRCRPALSPLQNADPRLLPRRPRGTCSRSTPASSGTFL